MPSGNYRDNLLFMRQSEIAAGVNFAPADSAPVVAIVTTTDKKVRPGNLFVIRHSK